MSSKLDVPSMQPTNIYTAPKEYINHPWYKSQNGLKRKHDTEDLDASSTEESSEDDAYISDDRGGGVYPTPPSSYPQTRKISGVPGSSIHGHQSSKRRCVALERNFAGMKLNPNLTSSLHTASSSYTEQQQSSQWPTTSSVISHDSDSDIPIFDAPYNNSPHSQMTSISTSSTRNKSPTVSISYLSPQMELNYVQTHPGAGFVMPSDVEEPNSSPEFGKDGGLLPSLSVDGDDESNRKKDQKRQAWFEPVKDRIVITDLDALASTDSEDNDVDNETTPKPKFKHKNDASSFSGVNPRRLQFNSATDSNKENLEEEEDYTMNALMLKYIEKHSLNSLVNTFGSASSSSDNKNDEQKSKAMALIPFRPVVPFAPQVLGTVPLPPINDAPLMGLEGNRPHVQLDGDTDMEGLGSMNGNNMRMSNMNNAPEIEGLGNGMDVDDPMDIEY